MGPTVGGLLPHSLSWPWLFLINLPIGVLGVVLGLRYVPRGEAGGVPQLDGAGFALIGLGLPLFVYAVTIWGERASIATVLVPLVLGVAGLVAFGVRAVRRPHPLLDLWLFRNPVYTAASVLTTFGGAAMFGSMLPFLLYFQVLRGTDVITTGLSLFSLGVGTTILLPVSGWLTDRYGGGIVALAGNLCTVVTTLPFAFLTADTEPVGLQVLLFLRGMALALTTQPAGTAAFATVRRAELPDATTQINILMRVGGALGGALFAVLLAQALPGGAERAFQSAFWWLTGTSMVSLGCAVWLWRTPRVSTVDSLVVAWLDHLPSSNTTKRVFLVMVLTRSPVVTMGRVMSDSSIDSPSPAAAAIRAAVAEFRALTSREPDGVTGVRKTQDGGWSVLIDVVELERIPATTTVMATYRVDIDAGGDLVACERLRRYTRGTTDL
ncbi:MAG TPA: gas vesicle protein GvpO [Amycolatopsis sp.]|uniref:gas vesicle protein GvpO n=1 Tax=Amycolatopsis sp. TaxID=37632 RepID=UPI002B47BF36|nr:gas vesicle protein GvpO [Amycolatopsis sp.]HKS46889.1 gas vesicle protein GvpO [Amycolatopsis sp.]